MEDLKKATWVNILYGILGLAVGILILVFAIVDQSVVAKVMSYSLGACLFLLALMFIISSIVVNQKQLFNATLGIGCFCIAVGVLLCALPNLLVDFLIVFIGGFLVALGFVSLIKMILAIVHKEKAGLIVTFALAMVLTVAIGVLALVYMGGAEKVLYFALAILLMVGGIASIVFGIKACVDAKKAAKEPAKAE